MKYTNAALILVIASASPYSSDAKAYIFAHINSKRVRGTTRINDILYAGYCVGCSAWNRSPSIDSSRPLNECKYGKMASTATHDIPKRRVREVADELPTHMMEMEPPAEDFTDGTDGYIKMEDGNLNEEDHSYIRQFIASILLFGVAATSYVLWNNSEKRHKLAIMTPKKGLEITIPTDLPPDLARATPMSTEDEVPESQEEISTLWEENQILQDKLAYYTAMERSYNNKSITSNPNDSVGKHYILTENRESPKMNATTTIQTLHNQIEVLKEELKETNDRLQNAINTNIALNDAHDREHQKLIILQKEMELSWEKFEETYRAQHEEMQRAEARERNLLRENKELKSSNRDLALKLSRRKLARA